MTPRAHAFAPASVHAPHARHGRVGARPRTGPPLASSAALILGLQRTAGNGAVTALLRGMRGPHHRRVHETVARGSTFSLQGQTHAAYAHDWRRENDQVSGGEHTGTLVENFRVTTTVTMPPMPSGLSECELPIVQRAMNRLAAHEQEHVTAFHSNYDGTERTPYAVSGNEAAVTRELTAQHAANESYRRGQADGASAALDPFQIDVDTSSCDAPAASESEGGSQSEAAESG